MNRQGNGQAVLVRTTTQDETAKRADRHRRQGPVEPAYAALDLGTNNCRLLAGRPIGGSLRIVDSFSRIVRLGEGIGQCGRLDEAAIERTIAALRICAGKIRRLNVRRTRNVATEACRRADNGADFLARVETETGLAFETITADEEARLTVAGCVPMFEVEKPYVLMFDIGGGSTEITWIRHRGGKNPQILATRSLPEGVMTIAEKHGSGRLNPDAMGEISERIDAELEGLDAAHAIADHVGKGEVLFLGTSGTVTTLGGVHLGLRRYDRSKVDGMNIPITAINRLIESMATLDEAQRARIPCIGRQRAGLMVAGCTLLSAILSRWPAASLRIADRGIREGILFELMAGDGLIAEDGRLPVSP
jgi:exopolyphosphatase / guanosine-5'-triphosphate,3'-diphosphate pyrophosphatase